MAERINFGQFDTVSELLEEVDTVHPPKKFLAKRMGILANIREENIDDLNDYGHELIERGMFALKRTYERVIKEDARRERIFKRPAVRRPPEFFEDRITHLKKQKLETLKTNNINLLRGINAALDVTFADFFIASEEVEELK